MFDTRALRKNTERRQKTASGSFISLPHDATDATLSFLPNSFPPGRLALDLLCKQCLVSGELFFGDGGG